MSRKPNIRETFMMILAQLPHRGTDDFGSGAFQSPRGQRTHKGIDFACYPETEIFTHVSGKVTKLGFPYANDLKFRYVEITDSDGNRHRFFYVQPAVENGELLSYGDKIGTAQDIAGRYQDDKRTMKNHVHYEILDLDNNPIDPGKHNA